MRAEHDRLVSGSAALAEIDVQFCDLHAEDGRLAAEADDTIGRTGAAGAAAESMEARDRAEAEALTLMGTSVIERARERYSAHSDRVTRANLRTIEDCDRLRSTLTDDLTTVIDKVQR